MAETTFINHRGAHDVSPQELALYQAPEPTETWFPIAHSQVLDAVSGTLQGAGFQIQRTRLSVTGDGHRFFGALDLSTEISDGISLAVGVRNSTDKSFPIGFCCGSRVFVCDNLSFTSEIVIAKKHTKFGQERYMEGIASAVQGLNVYREAAGHWIDNLRKWDVSPDEANSLILQSYEQDIIGARLLPKVIHEWRSPSHDEYQPRTGWSLWNCFTEVLGHTMQANRPAEAALTTIRLQGLLCPKTAV